jgi:rpsA: ribosomal protein S1
LKVWFTYLKCLGHNTCVLHKTSWR